MKLKINMPDYKNQCSLSSFSEFRGFNFYCEKVILFFYLNLRFKSSAIKINITYINILLFFQTLFLIYSATMIVLIYVIEGNIICDINYNPIRTENLVSLNKCLNNCL